MVFSSTIFLFVFLPIVLLAYYLCKKTSSRNLVLLLASLLFYAWGEPVNILLLLLSIMANWMFGLMVAGEGGKRKGWLIASVVFNLSLLFVFKYLGFTCNNINRLFGSKLDVSIALPIGISFFTFLAMSYVIDVYRGNGKALKKVSQVALYISLFPQLVAGPIVRYETIEKQIENR